MEVEMLRVNNVVEKTKLSRSTIYAWEACGKFPAKRKLYGKITYWLASEIDAWILSQQ